MLCRLAVFHLGRFALTCLFLYALGAGILATSLTGQTGLPKTRPPAPEHQFALLIGVNEYINTQWNTLHAPGNDVALFRNLLVERYGFVNDDPHISKLIGRRATRSAILAGFKDQLIANAKKYPDATLVFYYSGHGSTTNDGLHETIVPSDGRTEGIMDITDDDLSDLFDELLKYATKSTSVLFILDSCHSGTLVKGLDEGLHSKEIPPDSRPQTPRPALRSQSQLIRKDLGTGVLIRNDAFVALAAAYSYESAYEGCLPDQTGGFALPACRSSTSAKYKPYSLFTYYLTRALDGSPSVTYRQAIEEISAVVTKRAAQHPNAEGDAGRLFLGISADREDPFFSIAGPITAGRFTVNGGAVQGLEEGAYLAIYQPTVLKLKGEKGKLCNARVVKADDFSAIVELTNTPNEPIPAKAKVALITPYFGGRRFTLALYPPGVNRLSADRHFRDSIEKTLSNSPFVEAVDTSNQWDVGLKNGTLTKGDVRCREDNDGNSPWLTDLWTATAAESYEVVTPDRDGPLYGCKVLASDPDGSAIIAAILAMRFRQQSVRAITNQRAPLTLGGHVNLEIVKVTTETGPDGKPKITKEDRVPEGENHELPIGQRIKLTIINDSDHDIKAVIIDVGTSGGIAIMTPRGVGITVPAHKSFTTRQVFITQGASGIETFKLIAYTVDADRPEPNFAVLEQKGFIARGVKGIDSPLGWLITQAAGGTAKEAPLDSSLDVDSWVTSSINTYLK
jgi:hypothetical protein